jgi:hypothetical protein
VLRLLEDYYAERSKIHARSDGQMWSSDSCETGETIISTFFAGIFPGKKNREPIRHVTKKIALILNACMCVGEILSICLFQNVQPHCARQRLRMRGAFGYVHHARIAIDRGSIR